MKKHNPSKSSKKLSLAKATLRQLSHTQLNSIAGGTIGRLTTKCTDGCPDTD